MIVVPACLVIVFGLVVALGAYSFGWWWRGRFERESGR